MATPDSDLTAAARIREAALRLFAEHGVSGASIRDVAKAAGVSPGLVQHHFRSKARLRRAVEESVVRRATEAFGRPIGGDRKSTRLNSSHRCISYAVLCLKKKHQMQSISVSLNCGATTCSEAPW